MNLCSNTYKKDSEQLGNSKTTETCCSESGWVMAMSYTVLARMLGIFNAPAMLALKKSNKRLIKTPFFFESKTGRFVPTTI